MKGRKGDGECRTDSESKVKQVQLAPQNKNAAPEQRVNTLGSQALRIKKSAGESPYRRYNPHDKNDLKIMMEISNKNMKKLAKLSGVESTEPINIEGMLTDEFDADQSSVDIVKDARYG